MLQNIFKHARCISKKASLSSNLLPAFFSSQNKYRNPDNSTGAHKTFWFDSAPPKPTTSSLAADIAVDTCIIGAGIAGMTTAYLLAKQGQRVAVLEKGDIASGETGRTSGYFTWVIDDGLQNIIDLYGKHGAKLHIDSHRAAVDYVEEIVTRENIACGFKRVPNYWVSRKPKAKQNGSPDSEIQSEYDLQAELGMTESSIVDGAPWANDDGKCIRTERQGQLHTVAYLYGLAEKIQQAGGQIYTETKALGWKEGAETYVMSEAGNRVSCNSIVWAGNIPGHSLKTISNLEPYRSYITAGIVPKGKYEWIMFQDDSMTQDEAYYYGRFSAYDDTSDLIIIGGEDHLVAFETDFEERYKAIEYWAQQRYPDIEFKYRWSGQIQEPVDHVAYIGRDPGTSNVYMITGDSGMGLTHGTLGGKLISDLILGVQNPWANLYAPNRVKTQAIPDIVKHLAVNHSQLTDYFKCGDVTNVDDIIPGEGAVIARGTNRYAVYKDDEGKVSACTAVCPHLKGLLRWNSDEKSWDCPLHGARFDKFGRMLNGPAQEDLRRCNINEIDNK